jgi:hypothetical protein
MEVRMAQIKIATTNQVTPAAMVQALSLLLPIIIVVQSIQMALKIVQIQDFGVIRNSHLSTEV